MPHSEAVNWQPISEMPLIASMIDEALDDTRAHIKTLTEVSCSTGWKAPSSVGAAKPD
jgi:hypothetical protein